jgi:hypothetical protein
VRTTPRRTRAALEGVGSLKGFGEMEVELCIREFPGLITTPDQVRTRLRLRVQVVYQCPESTSSSVTNHGVTDFSADRVGHVNAGTFG